MHILIIGGAGYIGTNLCNYLSNKKYKLYKQKTMLLRFDELNFKKNEYI